MLCKVGSFLVTLSGLGAQDEFHNATQIEIRNRLCWGGRRGDKIGSEWRVSQKRQDGGLDKMVVLTRRWWTRYVVHCPPIAVGSRVRTWVMSLSMGGKQTAWQTDVYSSCWGNQLPAPGDQGGRCCGDPREGSSWSCGKPNMGATPSSRRRWGQCWPASCPRYPESALRVTCAHLYLTFGTS